MTIKIFQNEINDGIGELVKSTASVAYCSQATTFKGQQFSEKLASAMENTKVAEKILADRDANFDYTVAAADLARASAQIQAIRKSRQYLK